MYLEHILGVICFQYVDRCWLWPSQLESVQPNSLWPFMTMPYWRKRSCSALHCPFLHTLLQLAFIHQLMPQCPPLMTISLTIQFAKSSYSVYEGAGEVVLNLTANGTSAVKYTVMVDTVDRNTNGEHSSSVRWYSWTYVRTYVHVSAWSPLSVSDLRSAVACRLTNMCSCDKGWKLECVYVVQLLHNEIPESVLFK